jgi:cAMP-dependent protein kinase regulator
MNDNVRSPLDQAHAHHLDGEDEPALRLAITCAQAAPDAPGPIALIARVLVDAERTTVGPEVAARLVDAFIRRGDLASAVVASHIALDAGEEHSALLQQIAAAFGKGSARAAKVSPKPPPFPRTSAMPPALAKMSGDALFQAAENTLSKYLGAHDPIAADAQVPVLPLFGALKPDALLRLLKAVRVEEVSEGHEIVRQGHEGREAFVLARGMLRVIRKEGADTTVLAQLGPSAIFGEMALLSRAPRSASVIAAEPAQLLVLGREELERAALEAKSLTEELTAFCRGRMDANLLRHARVLSGLPAAQRAALLGKLKSQFFEAGQMLIERGQQAERIFLLASGQVSVSVPEGNERLVLATLGAGDVVGEISMVLRRPATADVWASHPTLAYVISAEQLHVLMREHPPLLVELYDLATRREDEVRAATAQGEDEALDAEDAILV